MTPSASPEGICCTTIVTELKYLTKPKLCHFDLILLYVFKLINEYIYLIDNIISSNAIPTKPETRQSNSVDTSSDDEDDDQDVEGSADHPNDY